MVESASELVPIDARLRLLFSALEGSLGVSLDSGECTRIFRDCGEDQVSAKEYALFESPHLIVIGRVDEYEPETIWIEARGGRGVGELLRRAVSELPGSGDLK